MRRSAVVLILLLIAPLAAQAQRRPLSLDEAVSAGLEASPALHAARMRADASAARALEMAAGRLPSVKLGAGYTRLSEVPPFEVTLPISPTPIVVSENYFNSWSLRLSVQQPLFTGFRLEAGTESARMLDRAAGQDLEKDRSEFIFAVKSAYWGLVRAREFDAVVGENVRQVREHLKDVRAFFDQGLLTRNEVLRTELQLSNAELLAIDARNAAEAAQTSLNTLIGLSVETDLELTTSVESLASRAPEEGAGEDPSAARSLIDRAGFYPQVALAGNVYGLRPNPRIMPARDVLYGTWDIGVAVSFDVWNWGQTKSQAEQAKAQLAQARDARKLLEDQAVLDVTQSRLALAHARDKIKVAAVAVGQAEENLRTVREMFRQGVALNADVMDAEVFLLQAKLSRTQAAIDLALAQARLEKALGS